TDEVGDFTLAVGHRGQVKIGPENRAILAYAARHQVDFTRLLQSFPYVVGFRLPVDLGVQERAAAADELVGTVTGHALESRVDVRNRIVGQACLGNHHAVVAGIQGA